MLGPEIIDSLQPCSDSPLSKSRQLYLGLYRAIVDGRLADGVSLPPSRELAERLGLARNTVIRVYSQLGNECLLHADGRRGTRVSYRGAQRASIGDSASLTGRCATGTSTPIAAAATLSSRAQTTVSQRRAARALAPGEPDASLFPEQIWRRAQAKASRLYRDDLGYRVSSLPTLQTAIARYLLAYRSLSVLPEQIIVTAGTRQSLLLAAAMYADPGDLAWVESPGYPGAVDAFRMQALDVQACPVDAEGLNPELQAVPRLVYLTPCFQYPSGVPLSATRRRELLQLSSLHGTVLFEDDYDSEFRDQTQPQPALAGETGSNARVLHAGTFSKLLFPAVRVAWLVVPPTHVDQAQALLRALGGGHTTLAQATVAELLDSGALARHLQNARQVYAQRRRVLLDEMTHCRHISVADKGQGSLSMVLELNSPCSRSTLEASLDAHGIGAVAMERLHWQRALPARCHRLVVGLGNVSSLALPDTIRSLDRLVGESCV